MVGARARPEDALLGVDPPVADARVVGRPTGAGPAQLVEDALGVGGEVRPPTQPVGERGQQPQVVPYAVRRRAHPPAADHPALPVGHRAVLLGPLRGREDDVGQGRGLRQEDVGHRQQVQRPQPAGNVPAVRSGDGRVRADHQERPDPAGAADPVQQLVRGDARTGQPFRVDAPHRGDVRPRSRVVQPPVAG